LNSRSLNLVLRKKVKQSEYWPRLTKDKAKNAFLKTDFSKWVDEDEQGATGDVPDEPEPDMGDMGMGGLPGGMGGPGGMDFEKVILNDCFARTLIAHFHFRVLDDGTDECWWWRRVWGHARLWRRTVRIGIDRARR
jgi:hypothetical protein